MHIPMQLVLFYIFAGLTVISALMAIIQNNPVRCVLFFVLAFFASSVLWLLMYAEFLAFVLVLVYVGAVMTLFLFVIMMLNIDIEAKRIQRYWPFGLLMLALLVGFLIIAISPAMFHSDMNGHIMQAITTDVTTLATSVAVSNTSALGMVLYTDQFFAFELAALILLVAIIAAITLVHRHARQVKQQDIRAQIMTRAADRLHLVKMQAE